MIYKNKAIEIQAELKKNQLIEMNKEILSMVEHMNLKWENGLVELINEFEYVYHNGDKDFMSQVRKFLLTVEGMCMVDKESSVLINGESFIEDGLPGFRYFTKNASVKYAYSFDEEPPLGENESYYMRIKWIEMDYDLECL